MKSHAVIETHDLSREAILLRIGDVSGLAETERALGAPAAPWIGAVIVFAAFTLGLLTGALSVTLYHPHPDPLPQERETTLSNGGVLKSESSSALSLLLYVGGCAQQTAERNIERPAAVGEFPQRRSAWSDRLAHTQEGVGSNPTAATNYVA